MRNTLAKILLCITATVQLLPLCACDNGQEYYILDNYSQYVNELVQYSFVGNEPDVTPDVEPDVTPVAPQPPSDTSTTTPSEPAVPPPTNDPIVPPLPVYKRAPEIVGFEPVHEFMFDKATNFFGEYAYVERDGINYTFDENGNLERLEGDSSETETDLELVEMSYDKMIVKRGELYGVLDIRGNAITRIEYADVSILGDLIIATKSNGKCDVFRGSNLLKKDFGEAGSYPAIVSVELIACGDKFYFVNDFSEAKFGEYFIADTPNDGIVKVRDNQGKFGYCSYPDGNVVVAPKYYLANEFFNGFAVVNNANNNIFEPYELPLIIDTSDNIKFDFASISSLSTVSATKVKVYANYNGYSVYHKQINNSLYKFGVVNLLSNPVEHFDLEFVPRNRRAYLDYAIENSTGKFYSLKDKAFKDDRFSFVANVGEYFIAKNGELYCLLDKNLNVVFGDCQLIESYNDTLLVKYDGKFAYYKMSKS